MNITKDNYRDIVWDEKITFDAYFDFYGSLDFEEQVTFLKFLLETYPTYDEDCIEHYFEIADTWKQENKWEELLEFCDFVREKSPIIYKKDFNYLTEDPIFYAAFHKDLEKVKIRFAESVAQPVKSIDDSLRAVFNVLSADVYFKDYVKEVAEKVWKPIAESDRLIGDASHDYTAYLYCDILESTFKKIKTGAPVDWEVFKTNVKSINFKYVNRFSELPNLKLTIDDKEFRINPSYREEKLVAIFIDMLYEVHTTQGIPTYWLYRTWFNLRNYLWKRKETTSEKNWFGFTPKMLDGIVHSLYGFAGNNREDLFITTWTLPYIFDYLLKKQYVDEVLFSRLMEYYQHVRRDTFRRTNQDLWKYKALYDWNKPTYISAEEFEQEKQLVLESIGWTREEANQKIQVHLDALPPLPSYVVPPKEPSRLEKMILERDLNTLPTISTSSSGSTRKLRKKKPKKKKHKDNRKRGAKKKKRK